MAALANANRPLTAYRVAKIVEMHPPNVYRELKRLLKGDIVTRTTTPRGSTVWRLRDSDLESFFCTRMRVSWSEDLLLGVSDRGQRSAAPIGQRGGGPINLSRFEPGRTLSAAERRRRRKKDLVLARAGARISVRKSD